MSEIIHQRIDLRKLEATNEGRRVEVKAARSTDGHTAASGAVCHVAAVAQLDGALRTGGMHRIGNPLQPGNDVLAHPELAVEGQATPINGRISQRSHPHPAACHGHMVVVQVLRGAVAIRHILESCGADNPVPQGHRADVEGSEYRRFNHINRGKESCA